MAQSSLNHLNTAAVDKKLIKLIDLELDVQYKIYSAKKTSTKFGDAILIELEDSKVFLPKRLTEVVVGDIMKDLNGMYI